MALTKIRQEQGVVINEGSTDVDFRIESNGVTDAFFVNGGDNQIEIGVPIYMDNSDTGTNVTASSEAAINIRNTSDTNNNTAGIQFQNSANTLVAKIGAQFIDAGDKSTDLFFATRANSGALTERMRIDSSGNVFIAKAAAAFGTAGHEFRANGLGIHTVSGNTVMEINRTTNTGILVAFNSDGSAKGSISTDGSSTAYNTSSDYRLKENVDYTWDATTRLKQLKPARFNFIADADTTVDGFLAHEAQAIVPNAVVGTKDEVDEDGVAVMQSIDNSKLVPLLVKTIQELEARLTAGGL